MPKLCMKCQAVIPLRIRVAGKERNLQSRKFCLKCSPFNKHNTKQLHVLHVHYPHKKYADLSAEQKKEYNRKIYNKQREKRWDLKKALVLFKGGKCLVCGYNKNLSALLFHHTNPETKLFEINGRTICAMKKQAIYTEVEKCVLLCSNCHAELHHPQFNDCLTVIPATRHSREQSP